MLRVLIVLSAILSPLSASALDVFACEPEWAALVGEIAASDTTVALATTAFQDPHSLQARPSMIAAVRNADLLVCSGADLEVGWLPLLLRRSGNPSIQPGSAGYLLAADHVRRLEIPQSIDRAGGDVHPQGNPHVHLHPRNIARVARALAERLEQVDPSSAPQYRDNLADFLSRWDAARDRWSVAALELAGLRVVSHHRSFSYLADWLELDVVATLEPKPGIPASGAQLARLLEQLGDDPPAMILRAPFENEKASRWLSQRLGIPVVTLPYTIGGADGVDDLFALFETTVTMLQENAK